jgi:hypothetical protein
MRPYSERRIHAGTCSGSWTACRCSDPQPHAVRNLIWNIGFECCMNDFIGVRSARSPTAVNNRKRSRPRQPLVQWWWPQPLLIDRRLPPLQTLPWLRQWLLCYFHDSVHGLLFEALAEPVDLAEREACVRGVRALQGIVRWSVTCCS